MRQNFRFWMAGIAQAPDLVLAPNGGDARAFAFLG
jgi:hypothetical protein